MGLQITGITIPIALFGSSNNSFASAAAGAPSGITIPVGATIQLPCALFLTAPNSTSPAGASIVTDLSNLVTADAVLRQQAAAGSTDPASGTLLWSQSISAASFNSGLTYAQFLAGGAHFTFTIPAAYTNQPAGNGYYMAIGVTTSASGVLPLVFNSGITIKDYGIYNVSAAPAAPSPLAYSEAASDARYELQTTYLKNLVFQAQIAALTGNTFASDGVTPASVDAVPTLASNPVAKPRYSKVEIYLRSGANRARGFFLDALGSSVADGQTIIIPADQAAAVAAGTFTGTQLAWFLDAD